jgi:hypothetical protein
MFPKKSVIRYDFPQRGTMPPVSIFWHDGLKESPKVPGVPEGELLGDLPSRPRQQGAAPRPRTAPNGYVGRIFNWEQFEEAQAPDARISGPNGSLFVGDKGMLTTGTYGEQTRLLPAAEKMKDYKFPEQVLTRSPGHYRDWIRSAKGGDPACSNFNVSVPFVEWMLLGVIALRVDGKLEWDAAKGRFTNNADANKYLKPTYRKGWNLT